MFTGRPALPAALQENRYSWDADADPVDYNRRSVYVYAKRNLGLPQLSAFDLPDRINSCALRAATTTAPQALVMLNGEFALTQARHLARLLLDRHGKEEVRLIREAYLRALSREPESDEGGEDSEQA